MMNIANICARCNSYSFQKDRTQIEKISYKRRMYKCIICQKEIKCCQVFRTDQSIKLDGAVIQCTKNTQQCNNHELPGYDNPISIDSRDLKYFKCYFDCSVIDLNYPGTEFLKRLVQYKARQINLESDIKEQLLIIHKYDPEAAEGIYNNWIALSAKRFYEQL